MSASILHVLDHSLPEQDGYSFRSHSILRELKSRGLAIAALTGPKQGPSESDLEEIDGISYRRSAVSGRGTTTGVLGQLRTISSTRRAIADYLRDHPTQIIHAHSPSLNGLASLGQGKPLLYEVRSSWEDAAVSIGTTAEGSARYRISRALETIVARRADEVVVICAGLKKDLLARGIDERKITIVPNALPSEMFETATADRKAGVRSRYGLGKARVIGFFGSFFEWEGVDLLIEALPDVIAAVPDAWLLLAGGGRQELALREQVKDMALGNRVIFAGRIAHEDVRAFYGAADVVAYPRVSNRLTDLVTPLKPLEAMAQGTPIVASDVGGHREQIDDGDNGFLFPAGSRAALVQRLVDVLEGRVDVRSAVLRARERVERNHKWAAVTERYLAVYERLAARHPGAVVTASIAHERSIEK